MARHPTLRDFLYLDIDRVRSLLAQLEGGVVESVVEQMKTSGEGRAGASIFGIFDIRGGLVREKASEQTKTLQDALYLVFELAAQRTGVLSSPDYLGESADWDSGRVHSSLAEGQLISVKAPARIFDPSHFQSSVERFAEWPRILASFSFPDELAAAKTPRERERKLGQLASLSMGGFDKQAVLDVAKFVDLFMAGQISLRQYPCGFEHPDYSLVGTLLAQPGFLQENRDALYGKYGSGLAEWTVISQVATIPRPENEIDELGEFNLMTDRERINRRQFEDMAASLMQLMETQGISDGPVYPAVTVTPIAVFREIDIPSD